MKHSRPAILASLLAMFAVSATAHSVTATLAVEPESRLPGLYRFWRIGLKNTGPAAAVVPNRMAVQVLPAAGSPSAVIRSFDVQPGHQDGGPLMTPLTLQPGESHDLTHSLLLDELLRAATQSLPPGSYSIQLVIDEALDPEHVPSTGKIADLPEVVDAIISSSVAFDVEAPTGADLEVWNILRTVAPNRWHSFADRIWRDHPDSQYAAEYVPYANGRNHARSIATYEEALRKKPHPDVAHEHRLIIAQHELDRGTAAIESSPNPDEAVAAFTRARAYVDEVIRHARLPHQLETARSMRSHALSREDVVRTQNALRGIYEARLVGYARCAEKLADGTFSVIFGSIVEGDKPFSYPVGTQNKFTPPPFDRGQNVTFTVGNKPSEFHVVTSEPELTWHLGKQNLVVKPRELTPCPPPVVAPEPEPQDSENDGVSR